MHANYTRDEERSLRSALERGEETPPCPRCGRAMERRGVPQPREVSYVRERVWLLCPVCRRSAVLDAPWDSGG